MTRDRCGDEIEDGEDQRTPAGRIASDADRVVAAWLPTPLSEPGACSRIGCRHAWRCPLSVQQMRAAAPRFSCPYVPAWDALLAQVESVDAEAGRAEKQGRDAERCEPDALDVLGEEIANEEKPFEF